MLIEDIMSGAIRAAYVHRMLPSIPIAFVHAGYSPKFLKYLQQHHKLTSIDAVTNFTSQALVSAVERCARIPCKIKGEVFDAGPDRGGRSIGGPL